MSTSSDRLALYLAAEKAVLEGGQTWQLEGRQVTLADIGKIQATIAELEAQVGAETATVSRRPRFLLADFSGGRCDRWERD